MKKTFKNYFKEEKESLSKEEEKDVIEAAHDAAKDIFGDDYDKETTEKLAKDLIKKYGKDNDVDAMIEIAINALQKD